MGILQSRILEWVAMPSSKGCSQRRGLTQAPHYRCILYGLSHQGSPYNTVIKSVQAGDLDLLLRASHPSYSAPLAYWVPLIFIYAPNLWFFSSTSGITWSGGEARAWLSFLLRGETRWRSLWNLFRLISNVMVLLSSMNSNAWVFCSGLLTCQRHIYE